VRQEPRLLGSPAAVACFHPRAAAKPLALSSASTVRSPAQAQGGETERPLIDLQVVSKTFPVRGQGLGLARTRQLHAVTDVTLAIRQAETLGVVGESGCGKSTLGRILVGLDKPTGGNVLYEGEDINVMSRSSLRRKRVGLQMMFQDPYASLDPRLSVEAIIREPLVIQGRGTRADQRRRVLELLDEVGLPRRSADRRPHEFSGGQRQRIGLARALALRPRVIVADEPVSALDVSIQAQILNLMRELQRAHEMTYVFISHDLAVVRYLADRVAVMYLGQLVELAPADHLYRQPAHPYTAGLLRAVPLPDPASERQRLNSGIPGELPSPVDPPSGCPFRTRCERATDRCAAERPALMAMTGDHFVACHHPLAGPAALSPRSTGGHTVRT
jgi:peptide/nickel transport system ATP-binding protein